MKYDYALGALSGFAVSMIISAFSWFGNQPPQKGVESPRFEVVDSYRGCDVVRYEVHSMATYQYFLDCSKKNDN